MIYSAYGVNYDKNVTLGTSGTVVFPVLPCTAELKIWNLDPANIDSVTVTVTDYY